MIIQCEQCSTKFRLDDSRIKDNGVKVRCAKCRHVFTVKKEQPDAVQKSDFGVILDQTQGFGETSLPVDSFEPHQADNSPESQPEQQLESPAASPCVKPVNVADLDFSAFEGSQDDRQAAEAFKAEFSFGSPTAQPDRAHPPAEAPSLSNDAVDFDNVVFGDVSAEAPTGSMAGAPHTEDGHSDRCAALALAVRAAGEPCPDAAAPLILPDTRRGRAIASRRQRSVEG